MNAHPYAHIATATLEYAPYLPNHAELQQICEDIALLVKINELQNANPLVVPIVKNQDRNLWHVSNTLRMQKPKHIATFTMEVN